MDDPNYYAAQVPSNSYFAAPGANVSQPAAPVPRNTSFAAPGPGMAENQKFPPPPPRQEVTVEALARVQIQWLPRCDTYRATLHSCSGTKFVAGFEEAVSFIYNYITQGVHPKVLLFSIETRQSENLQPEAQITDMVHSCGNIMDTLSAKGVFRNVTPIDQYLQFCTDEQALLQFEVNMAQCFADFKAFRRNALGEGFALFESITLSREVTDILEDMRVIAIRVAKRSLTVKRGQLADVTRDNKARWIKFVQDNNLRARRVWEQAENRIPDAAAIEVIDLVTPPRSSSTPYDQSRKGSRAGVEASSTPSSSSIQSLSPPRTLGRSHANRKLRMQGPFHTGSHPTIVDDDHEHGSPVYPKDPLRARMQRLNRLNQRQGSPVCRELRRRRTGRIDLSHPRLPAPPKMGPLR